VKTLIGLNSSNVSNIPLDLRTNLWRLLRDGEVLYQIPLKWVIRLSPTTVVKFAPGLDISEIQTMRYIWQHKEIIPMPEPLGAISIGWCHYIFISYIEGVTLAEVWPHLTPHLKTSVQSQLGEILQCLRKVPLQSEYLGSGDPPLCRDIWRHVRISPTSISTETEFNAFLTSTQRELNPVYRKLLTSKLGTGHRIVMTHGDIRRTAEFGVRLGAYRFVVT
jgi:aminoglycoside phosphotransferase (APT) family kinase protein